MMSSVFEALFGCSHQRTTFPQTLKNSLQRQGTHVTCLDCGREFPYNWKEMRMVTGGPAKDPVLTPSPVQRPPAVQHALSRLLRLGH